MKFKGIYLFVCLMCSGALLAQNKVKISGQVKDVQTKNALEFCSVSVLNAQDSLVAGTITDQKGFFSVPVVPGVYKTVLSFIGYKNDTTPLTPVTANVFLGVFKLEPDVEVLKEFTVVTKSSDNLIDRDVQIVTDKMKAGASNTRDVLDKLPGVDYDRYSNAVKVDNDARVIILVDGMEKDQDYIKNLSPDRLKKIEVIRDPGGRYALEGYSAVINVILKKNYQGVELLLNNESMADSDAGNIEKTLIINNASGTFNYTYNKLNIYTKYNGNYSNFALPSYSGKAFDNGLAIENNIPSDMPLNTDVRQLSHNYTLGADFFINPRHTLSYEGHLSGQPASHNKTTVTLDNNILYNGALISNFSSVSENVTESQSSSHTLFYQGILNEKNTVNAHFSFSDNSYTYTNDYIESTPYQRLENGINNKTGTRFYTELTHTFSARTNIQGGYGHTWEKQHNSFSIADAESTFDYSDRRHKLYGYFSHQMGKKTGIKLGCAAETSNPETPSQEKFYFIFLPYADLKYDPSAMFSFKLKYRAASAYPAMEQTNPFTYVIDRQSVKTGNPALRPEVTHKISLQANIMGGLANIEPYYHFSDNYIADAGRLINDSLFEYTYSNAGHYKNYGLQANITIPFGKKLFLQNTLDLYNSSITHNNVLNHIKGVKLSEQLVYVDEPSGFVAGLQYQKNLQKYITAQGYNKGDNDFWITFIQKPFFKQKLSLTLIYFMPVSWGCDFIQGSYIHTANYTESRWSDISFLKNIVMLQASYRFNKGKTITKTEKIIEKDAEKSTKGKFL